MYIPHMCMGLVYSIILFIKYTSLRSQFVLLPTPHTGFDSADFPALHLSTTAGDCDLTNAWTESV